MNQCTFEPKLSSRLREKSFRAKSNCSQYEKNKNWLEEKQKKIKKLQTKEKKNELKGISFKPDIKKSENFNNSRQGIHTTQIKGV